MLTVTTLMWVNGALRTSSMADTLTGSCLFVPISPIKKAQLIVDIKFIQ